MMKKFLEDTLRGLKAEEKFLDSRYFYDEVGDEIFREIMNCPEYYVTRCELEILSQQRDAIIDSVFNCIPSFDVVELGAGDCSKSVHLLEALRGHNVRFTYYPIDISANVIAKLDERVSAKLPGINIKGLNGDYFDMLDELKQMTSRFKLVLFLGSSIGNIPAEGTVDFLRELRSHLLPGDVLLTGFDLKKDPATILAAYNDEGGVTRRFNLNLLERLNKTFGANFNTANFEHKPVYEEHTGACRSYLHSRCVQTIHIGGEQIHFKEGERLYMEVSQKYTSEQTDAFAAAAGFKVRDHFYDQKQWFLDALWQYPLERK